MITKSDLELICNYQEVDTNGLPVVQISYFDFIKDVGEMKREIIRERREKVVDAIIDNKVEEFEKFRDENPIDSEPFMSSISPRLMTKTLSANKFISYDDLWNITTKRIESLTSNKTPSSNVSILGLEYDGICRRVVSKCLMLNNMIASNSFSGPATTIIVGRNIIPYLMIPSYVSVG
jgi:hypothetical protein